MNKSAPSAALLHKQNNPASETEINVTATGAPWAFYGFLVEEPIVNPLYLILTDAADNIIMSFECGTKFGRDGQSYALKAGNAGLKAKLSTSRTAVVAPAFGTTLHIWFSV